MTATVFSAQLVEARRRHYENYFVCIFGISCIGSRFLPFLLWSPNLLGLWYQAKDLGPKHQLDSLICIFFVNFQTYTPYPLVVFLIPSLLTLPLSLFPLSSLFFQFIFQPPPLPLMSEFSLLIQSLLSDALIIIVSPIHMHLHFHQNPKKPLCLLRILFKLVPSAKQRSVASSLKALTTLGNQLESNHFIITFAPPHQSIVDQTLQATLER